MVEMLQAQAWLGSAWLGEEGNEYSLDPHEAIRLHRIADLFKQESHVGNFE